MRDHSGEIARTMGGTSERLLGRWDFEGGGRVEIRVYGSPELDAVLDMIETLVAMRRAELARKNAVREQGE